MGARVTLEDVAAMLRRLFPATTQEACADRIRLECAGLPYDARVEGSDAGRATLSFIVSLGRLDTFEDRFSLSRLIQSAAATSSVRVVLEGPLVLLETRVVPDETTPDQLHAVVRWRLSELCPLGRAWRARLGLAPTVPPAQTGTSLAALVATTHLTPQKALLVAAVGFAVAGADGRFSEDEIARLRAWRTEFTSFATLDHARVMAVVTTLVRDSARTLLEARRRLDAGERLLCWALANDMAHADGFTSAEERHYLASVASIFELSPDAMEPFVADAQARAVRRETPTPPPAPF
jgi:tellurite resistance protein